MEKQQDRRDILLRATLDILKKCDEWIYVKNVLEIAKDCLLSSSSAYKILEGEL